MRFLCIWDASIPSTAVTWIFRRLHRLHTAGAFFVVRLRAGIHFYVVASRRVDQTVGLRCDQTIRLSSVKGSTAYQEELRRVSYVDRETKQALVFLTNRFDLAAHIMPRFFGAAGPSNFSSAGSSRPCACGDFSATHRTACGPNLARTVRLPFGRHREAEKNLALSTYEILQIVSASWFD